MVGRLPPKMMAEMGTPSGFCHSGSMVGHWLAGAVNLAFGWAAFRPQSGVHFFPVQSMSCCGGVSLRPSHQTSPSSVRATLVNMQLAFMDSMALGLDFHEVPGATPKYPVSGLMA